MNSEEWKVKSDLSKPSLKWLKLKVPKVEVGAYSAINLICFISRKGAKTRRIFWTPQRNGLRIPQGTALRHLRQAEGTEFFLLGHGSTRINTDCFWFSWIDGYQFKKRNHPFGIFQQASEENGVARGLTPRINRLRRFTLWKFNPDGIKAKNRFHWAPHGGIFDRRDKIDD